MDWLKALLRLLVDHFSSLFFFPFSLLLPFPNALPFDFRSTSSRSLLALPVLHYRVTSFRRVIVPRESIHFHIAGMDAVVEERERDGAPMNAQ